LDFFRESRLHPASNRLTLHKVEYWRRSPCMRVFAGSLFLLLSFAADASAQISNANIFVGYSYMSADIPNAADRKNLNGWEASLEGKVLPFISIVADGSGHYGTTSVPVCPVPVGGSCAGVNGNLHTALFGPRASFSILPVRPFAHVLFG